METRKKNITSRRSTVHGKPISLEGLAELAREAETVPDYEAATAAELREAAGIGICRFQKIARLARSHSRRNARGHATRYYSIEDFMLAFKGSDL